MKTIDLIQGSPEWHAHRANHFNASDAPAMMGVSTYETRTQLMTRLKTGITADVDAATQRRFDEGHRIEALARPLAEAIIGEELYPITGASGRYSASFDGLTLEGNVAFEHKTLNDDLRAAFEEMDHLPLTVQEREAAKSLHPMYRIQMEQQCMVSGADRVLFMATKWNGDELVAEHHCWYFADMALRGQIVAGWEQLAKDLETFEPPVVEVKPVGQAPNTLPALRIEVTGQVTFSNLSTFKTTALTAIRSVNRELETDQDFADAEMSVKWCTDVEDKLAAAKQHALSQTTSIDELFKAIDDISAEARRVRLDLDKLIKARKEQIRSDIVIKANTEFESFVAGLNQQFGKRLMPHIETNFAGAIKGKKTVASLQDAVDTELARAKTEANMTALNIKVNLGNIPAEWEFLFPDLPQVAAKEPEDFNNLISARTAQYLQTQEDARQAALRKEQDSKIADWCAANEESQQAIQKAFATPPADIQSLVVELPQGVRDPLPFIHIVDNGKRIKLGDINARLHPIQLTSDGLHALGFAPAAVDRSAKLYRESDFPRICAALVQHIKALTEAILA